MYGPTNSATTAITPPTTAGSRTFHNDATDEAVPIGTQRHFIFTNGTSPRPAAISSATSASFAWRHDLHQTCTRYPVVREIERGVGSSWESARRSAISAQNKRRLADPMGRRFRLANHDTPGSRPPSFSQRDGASCGLILDRLPSGHVVADQRHVFPVSHPADEGADQ
jgi:hypothetical protein